MGTLKRKDLRPAREISDEAFLRAAAASATRAARRLERERLAEVADLEAARAERALARKRNQASPTPT